MSIESHVINIAANMAEPPKVFWGAMYEQNLSLDEAESATDFPVILMYPTIVKTHVRANGQVLNDYIVVLSFIDKIAHAEEQNSIANGTIQNMRALAFEFISKAIEYIDNLGTQQEGIEDALLHSLDPTKKFDTDQFFDQYDLNVAGYGLTISIPLLENINTCA